MVNHGLKSVLRKPSLISSPDPGGAAAAVEDSVTAMVAKQKVSEGGRGTIDLVGRASLPLSRATGAEALISLINCWTPSECLVQFTVIRQLHYEIISIIYG